MDFALFQKFRDLVHRTCGIALSDAKQSLLVARIGKRIRELGMRGEQEYFDYLTRPENQGEITAFVDVISTNVTSFFREPEHFTILEKVLRLWEDKGQSAFRIWCAASSSGEEPYTIAMTCLESLQSHTASVKILATDISTQVLRQAVQGAYSQNRIQAVPPPLLKKYFKCKNEKGGERLYEIDAQLKNMIRFKRLNLKSHPLPLHGPLDIIFCRNVMIYFDRQLKTQLIGNFFDLLKPGGILFVSHTESLAGIQKGFVMRSPSIYVKPSMACEVAHAYA